MNDAAYEQLIDRLQEDGALVPASVDAILAATEGAEVLLAHLDGEPAPARRDSVVAEFPSSRPAYISSMWRSRTSAASGHRRSCRSQPGPG